MSFLKLFLFSMLLGAGGGTVGFAAVTSLGRVGGIVGGFLVGGAMVAAAVLLAAHWEWITPDDRLWAILGGWGGFGLAAMVTLATIGSARGHLISPVLIGLGTVLGALAGRSPHTRYSGRRRGAEAAPTV